MWKNLISGSALCIAISAAPVIAQEQTETETPKEPEIGQPYLGSNELDWDVVCLKTEKETDPCEMRQLILDQNKDPMIEITLERLSGQQGAVAGATVVVPLETILTVPLVLSVDGAKGKQYPFTFCNAVGCIARIGLSETDVNAMKKGKTAELSLSHLTVPDNLIRIPISLNGFTAAYDKTTVTEVGD